VLRDLKRDPTTAEIPVMMLTGKADESDQLVGFALGADDYVCKPFSGKLLLARVESLLRRARTTPEPARLPVSVVAPVRLDRAQFSACVGDQMVALSKIEYRILATLIAAQGRVLEGKVLLGLAVGKSDDAVDQRIESHIATLQKKLGPASPCIQEVRGVGYAYCSPEAIPPGTQTSRGQS
jgi:two-component system phosphate regulon response regulator PhoB